jgi:hypothetical protein
MSGKVKLLDVVALLSDKPERGLVRGQVGTAVEEWAPGVWEVEFLDDDGRTYALTEFEEKDLLVLVHTPVAA